MLRFIQVGMCKIEVHVAVLRSYVLRGHCSYMLRCHKGKCQGFNEVRVEVLMRYALRFQGGTY